MSDPARVRRSTASRVAFGAALLALSEAAAAGCAEPRAAPRAPFGQAPGRTASADFSDGVRATAGSRLEQCPERTQELAQLSCDETTILVGRPLTVHPDAGALPEAARQTLDSVARLLEERQDLLLVRIEVYSARDPGPSPASVRREITESQRRADRIFRDLWKRGRVWAERLEAVGYGFRRQYARAPVRYPIVLRVIQRARRD